MNSRHRPLRAGSGGPSRPLLPFQGNSPSPLIAPPATALGPYSTASYRRPLVGGAAACVLSPTPVQIRTTLLPPPSGEVSSAVPREADDGGGPRANPHEASRLCHSERSAAESKNLPPSIPVWPPCLKGGCQLPISREETDWGIRFTSPAGGGVVRRPPQGG